MNTPTLRHTAPYAFGNSGHFYLPALLNFHKVSLDDFTGMRIANKPGLLRQMLVHVKPALRFPLRNYLNRHPKATAADLFRRVTLDMTMAETRDFHQKLKDTATKLAKDFRLYDSPDGVKSEIAGTFSYDDSDSVDAELEMWRDAKCGECSHVEQFRDDGCSDDVADVLDDFERLSGPYCRCSECGSVTRLTITESDSLPDSAYTHLGEDDWEYYQEHLDHLISELTADLKAKGLPVPDGLAIHARSIDWRGRDGYAKADLSGEGLADKVRVDSQFIVYGGQLILPQTGTGYMHCSLAHHDATGGVTIEPHWDCELEDRYHSVVGDDALSCSHLCRAAEALFCGPESYHEFNPDSEFRVVSEDGFYESRDNLVSRLNLWDGDPIRHFLERIDVKDKLIIADALAIRDLIDERQAREEEDAA